MVMEDAHRYNLKLRHGRLLELKKRVRREQDGVEHWERAASVPTGGKADAETVMRLLESSMDEDLRACGRLMREKPFWMVQVDKVRWHGAAGMEEAVLRVSHDDRVEYVESFCVEGISRKHISDAHRDILATCDIVGGYNVFLLHWIKG